MAVVKPVSWQELGRLTIRETLDDDCLGLAAQLSHYFFLSLFPALLFLVAVASAFRLSNAADDVARVLGSLLSPEIITLVQEQMRRLADAPDGGMATIGLLGAFWSSSAAIVAIVTAVNRAYDRTETRPWWRIRITAIVLTLFLGLVIIVALGLLLAGPGLDSLLGVPADSALWSRTWNYEAAYGSLAGVAVLLLRFYLSGVGLRGGAELDSEVEHAAEYGQSPVVHERTGRRQIGARAARAFARRHRDAREKSAHENTPSRPAPPARRLFERFRRP